MVTMGPSQPYGAAFTPCSVSPHPPVPVMSSSPTHPPVIFRLMCVVMAHMHSSWGQHLRSALFLAQLPVSERMGCSRPRLLGFLRRSL